MLFGKTKISTRLATGLGLIIAFMIIIVGIGIWSLNHMNAKIETIIKVDNAKITLAQTIQNAINSIDKSVLTIILGNDEALTKQERQKIEAQRAIYKASIAKLEGLETTKTGKELIRVLKESFEIAQNANDKAIELIATGNTQQATYMIMGTIQISQTLAEECEKMVKYQQVLSIEAARTAHSTFIKALYILIIVGGVVFVFAIFLAIFLTRSITRPLKDGVDVVNRISEGDLTATIEVSGDDETGQLLSAMRGMVTRLQNIIGEVKTAAKNMASASRQLKSNSEIMSKGAKDQAAKASQGLLELSAGLERVIEGFRI
jgi:methyl-accepting chemotaxis protein